VTKSALEALYARCAIQIDTFNSNSSLQLDLLTRDPRICDFVEAVTNTFMNFLFAFTQ